MKPTNGHINNDINNFHLHPATEQSSDGYEIKPLNGHSNNDTNNFHLHPTTEQPPDGYEIRRTRQGEVYFHHVATGFSTWDLPRVPRTPSNVEDFGSLPNGWEKCSPRKGIVYYVDHNTQTAHFTEPRSTGKLAVKNQCNSLDFVFPSLHCFKENEHVGLEDSSTQCITHGENIMQAPNSPIYKDISLSDPRKISISESCQVDPTHHPATHLSNNKPDLFCESYNVCNGHFSISEPEQVALPQIEQARMSENEPVDLLLHTAQVGLSHTAQVSLSHTAQVGLSENEPVDLSHTAQVGLSHTAEIGLSHTAQVGLSEMEQVGLTQSSGAGEGKNFRGVKITRKRKAMDDSVIDYGEERFNQTIPLLPRSCGSQLQSGQGKLLEKISELASATDPPGSNYECSHKKQFRHHVPCKARGNLNNAPASIHPQLNRRRRIGLVDTAFHNGGPSTSQPQPEQGSFGGDTSGEKSDYLFLLALDVVDLVTNVEPFKCPLCSAECRPKKGAILKDCLHSFCRVCLYWYIVYSDDAVLKCPFRNDEYSCESYLQEREIKSLVSAKEYERHLACSLEIAESQAQNSFHCKTSDCPGWCLFEDNVDAFLCPVCLRNNCINCAAVHEGMNCIQYQNSLEFQSDTSEEVRNTGECLQLEDNKKTDYSSLLALDVVELVANAELFECPVCFLEIDPGKGVVLKDCLHSFCRECLVSSIRHSETAVIKCPFANDKYSCESYLQEREIKCLVTPEVYERHLSRSMALVENQAQDSFHCKTPDCPGWCFFEDTVNTFFCPVCHHTNCMTCAAVHEGKNCKQYQDRLELDIDTSTEARQTRDYLQSMLMKKEAMECPKCKVILMKKSGCDWLICSMCQTEICWVTRGPRWGPSGRMDTSGGCRCLLNGVRCHPRCKSCH